MKVYIEGRPRSTVVSGRKRAYEVDVTLEQVPGELQTLRKNGIEMVLVDEDVADVFIRNLTEAFKNVKVVMHGR